MRDDDLLDNVLYSRDLLSYLDEFNITLWCRHYYAYESQFGWNKNFIILQSLSCVLVDLNSRSCHDIRMPVPMSHNLDKWKI